MKLPVPPQGHRSIIERLVRAAVPQLIGKPFDGLAEAGAHEVRRRSRVFAFTEGFGREVSRWSWLNVVAGEGEGYSEGLFVVASPGGDGWCTEQIPARGDFPESGCAIPPSNLPLHQSVPPQGNRSIIERPATCGGPAGERQTVRQTTVCPALLSMQVAKPSVPEDAWPVTLKAATIAVAAIAFLTCACESRPISVGVPKSHECDASTRSVTEDEAIPYGFSVADVLPLISGRLDGTLTWHSSPDVQVSPSGTTTLHLELVPRLDEVTLQSGCGTYLYLPTDMSLSTDDGGLAEHRGATFQVTSKEKLSVILLLYSAGSGWAPAGSLRVAYEGTSVWDVESLTMDISFTSSGTQGDIEYSARTSPPGNATTSISATVATWVPKATSDAGPD